VPCGLAPEDGLPVGLQIMAPVLADDRLYRVAAAVEAALEQRWGHPLLDEARGLDQAGGPAGAAGRSGTDQGAGRDAGAGRDEGSRP
jgi:hypothetical protein